MIDKSKMTNKRRLMEDYHEALTELTAKIQRIEELEEEIAIMRAQERGEDYAENITQ